MRNQFNLAKKQLDSNQLTLAFFNFGIGLHALQDATSPAHAGFQEWSGEETIMQTLNHVKQETSYPGEDSNLQLITNQYFDWFLNSNTPLPSRNLFDGINHD